MSPVSISVHLDPPTRLLRAMEGLSPRRRRDVFARAMKSLSFAIQANATEKQIIRGGSGPPHPTRLTSRTGTGRRSIGVDLTRSPDEATIGSELRYMALHETGGTVQIPEIVPRNARVLRWVTRSGDVVFAMRARAHSVRMPPRPWLQPALDAVLPDASGFFFREYERAVR